MENNNEDGTAVASLVLGIISLLFFPLVLGIIAVFLGLVSENKGGMAAAGIIMGLIGILIGGIQWINVLNYYN